MSMKGAELRGERVRTAIPTMTEKRTNLEHLAAGHGVEGVGGEEAAHDPRDRGDLGLIGDLQGT